MGNLVLLPVFYDCFPLPFPVPTRIRSILHLPAIRAHCLNQFPAFCAPHPRHGAVLRTMTTESIVIRAVIVYSNSRFPVRKFGVLFPRTYHGAYLPHVLIVPCARNIRYRSPAATLAYCAVWVRRISECLVS